MWPQTITWPTDLLWLLVIHLMGCCQAQTKPFIYWKGSINIFSQKKSSRKYLIFSYSSNDSAVFVFCFYRIWIILKESAWLSVSLSELGVHSICTQHSFIQSSGQFDQFWCFMVDSWDAEGTYWTSVFVEENTCNIW